MSKQAKFFCENCGNEVKGNARFCPSCGKFFSSVRCPKCGKIGSTRDFANGCPQCGYAEGKENSVADFNQEEKNISKKLSAFKARREERNRKRGEDSLPIWVYIVAAIMLISIIAIFCLAF